VAIDFALSRRAGMMYAGSEGTPAAMTSGGDMGKTGRKRRARKKKGANHGKRPNA
jgi:hypothetical protein